MKKQFCDAEHRQTGARCELEPGHVQNHRGQFDNGIAQWPEPISPLQDETPPKCQRPYCCPVCQGRRRMPAGFYGAIGVSSWSVSDMTPENCRSCQGTGVMWR